jgi:DNA-binding SARP family transcriptional activator
MLSVRVLGSQAVLDASTGEVRTRSVRTIALLALLVARSDRPQERATIAGLFWPESSDSQALTNLRRELHQLRGLLGTDDSLEVGVGQLCWHDRRRHDIDLATFLREATACEDGDARAVVEHGTTALMQYAGRLLPALDEPWLDELRRELEQRCSRLCERVCAAARSLGRTDVAIAAVRKRLSIDSYDEVACRTLMELHAESGDRAGAISVYHQFASLLERDLGIAPDQQTAALLTRLLGERLGRATPGRAGDQSVVEPELVGRRAELQALLETWRIACTQQARVVVVQGGAGVGKSRLVAELVTLARHQGAVVGRSKCFDTSGRLSLAPVADWLREPDLLAARNRLRQEWRDEADLLVPVDPRPPGAATVPAGSPGPQDVWQRHRFFEGLARALLSTSRPVLLVLDNLEWSDPDTRSFARFLLNFAPLGPLLVAVTLRSGPPEWEAGVDTWVSRMRDDGLLTEIALQPLDLDGTTALAEAVCGHGFDLAAAQLLYHATGGFPLYVVEAARSQPAERSADGDLVGWMGILPKRIRQLSPAAREVAGLAAAVGRDFTMALIAEASDLDPETVVVAVDELWRRRIIREIGDRYDFSHDLLRNAAYDAVSPPRRWLLHRRLAQALEILAAGHPDAVAAQLAEQYRRAGNASRAMRFYRHAADVASTMFAHEETLSLLAAARELLASMPPGRDRDEEELTLLELSVPPLNALYGYSSPLVREACERSVALADHLGQTARMLKAMVGLWASRFVQGRLLDSYRLAEQAVTLVGPADEGFGQAHFSLAASSMQRGRPQVALEHFRIAHAVMGDEQLSVGTVARVHTKAWWAHASWACGDFTRAADLAAEASAEARTIGHRYTLVVARAFEAITHQLMGDRSACADAAGQAREVCRRCQFTYYDDWGRILEGWALGGAPGTQLIEAGLTSLRAAGAYIRMPYWLGLLAQTTPDPAYARQTLDVALDLAERSGERLWTPELLRLKAAHLDGSAGKDMLLDAIEIARAQHSPAMLALCEADLDGRSSGVAASR